MEPGVGESLLRRWLWVRLFVWSGRRRVSPAVFLASCRCTGWSVVHFLYREELFCCMVFLISGVGVSKGGGGRREPSLAAVSVYRRVRFRGC